MEIQKLKFMPKNDAEGEKLKSGEEELTEEERQRQFELMKSAISRAS